MPVLRLEFSHLEHVLQLVNPIYGPFNSSPIHDFSFIISKYFTFNNWRWHDILLLLRYQIIFYSNWRSNIVLIVLVIYQLIITGDGWTKWTSLVRINMMQWCNIILNLFNMSTKYTARLRVIHLFNISSNELHLRILFPVILYRLFGRHQLRRFDTLLPSQCFTRWWVHVFDINSLGLQIHSMQILVSILLSVLYLIFLHSKLYYFYIRLTIWAF